MMRTHYFKNLVKTLILSYSVLMGACRKFVDVETPFTNINTENVYNNEENAISVLTGLYTKMSNFTYFNGMGSIPFTTGLSSDELSLFNGITDPAINAIYRNELISNSSASYGSDFWGFHYNLINTCNAALENIMPSKALSVDVKRQLIGEAKFVRAYLYFNLVNIYGDVPLITNTKLVDNISRPRTPTTQVYQQIILDLTEAKSELSSDYLDANLKQYSNLNEAERVRPTSWAAKALLSRVYLYVGDYANAEVEASEVIKNSNLFKTVSLNDVFLKNSFESIWQLQPLKGDRNTDDARVYILNSNGPNAAKPVYISQFLLNSFDSNDLRKFTWIDSVKETVTGTTYYFPYKYKNDGATVTEYLVLFRLAEMYLIRSEARVWQNNITGAKEDLNVTRNRAGLVNTNANSKEEMVVEIMNERQRELFTESGHRWFDLNRTSIIDNVMNNVTPKKYNGGIWKPFQKKYPIPFSELLTSSNLVQNQGY